MHIAPSILFLAAIALTSACGAAPEQGTPGVASNQTGLCSLDTSDSSAWMACDGKVVSIVGDTATQVLAHPMAGGPGTHQSYLDVNGAQVVISSETVSDCIGKRRVTGILNRVDLGGPPGTRRSYQGWSITHATIVCQ